MKKSFFATMIFLLSISTMEGNNLKTASNRSSNISRKSLTGTIHLLNKDNLDGWYKFIKNRGRNNDPENVFSVKNGLLHITGKEWGCITSDEEYDNYKIVVEYKWGKNTCSPRQDKARDSGLLLHSTGPDGGYNGTWMHSIECNIIEGGTGDFIVVGDGTSKFSLTSTVAPEKQAGSYIYQPDGIRATINGGRINWLKRDPDWKDVKNFRGKNDLENPIGKWNRIECIVNKGEISVYVNGEMINHAMDVNPAKGRIQIQSEGAEIFFRKIDLTPIP